MTQIRSSGILATDKVMALATFKRDPRFLWVWRMLAPIVATYMFINSKVTLGTSRVIRCGPGRDYPGAVVYVNWHKHVPFLCIHHGQYRRWLLMSSAPYMEPVALWCRWLRLTVVRGAPGERGRESLVHLIEALKTGHSVILAADGPAGPAFQVKPGCVDLARAADVPIIPVAYRSKRGKSNPKRWDQLYSVRKFDRIEVWYGAPIILNSFEPDAAALERVRIGLEGLS